MYEKNIFFKDRFSKMERKSVEGENKKMENSKKKKVLFICSHNSARSQMAEGVLRALYPERYEAYSAGTDPLKVNPHAVKVMEEIGIDISRHRAKSIQEFKDELFDYVVTVCEQAKESCPFFPGKKVIHRSFPVPPMGKGREEDIIEAFREIRDEIVAWVATVFEGEHPA